MGTVRLLTLAAAMFASLPTFSSQEARAVQSKFDRIHEGHAKPGSTVTFGAHELNVWVAEEVPSYAPHGVRNTRIELGRGTATASALIDFLKVRQAQGAQTNWLIAKLIEGEHPVTVSAHISSSGGRATVYLQSVEISGMTITGNTLDFLIDNFLRPLFPDAHINEPFELDEHVDRIEVQPDAARAYIRGSPMPPAKARSR